MSDYRRRRSRLRKHDRTTVTTYRGGTARRRGVNTAPSEKRKKRRTKLDPAPRITTNCMERVKVGDHIVRCFQLMPCPVHGDED